MSAPRVPAGWTREAADAVWLDWQHAVGGSAGIRIWCFLALGPYPHMLTVDGYEIINPKKDSKGRVLTGWTSPEARLRAWAAVGAPVIAPAEDGNVEMTADEPVTLHDAFTGGAMYVAYAVAAGRVPTPVSVRAAADLFVAHSLREAAQ